MSKNFSEASTVMVVFEHKQKVVKRFHRRNFLHYFFSLSSALSYTMLKLKLPLLNQPIRKSVISFLEMVMMSVGVKC